MSDQPLAPASLADVRDAIAHALRFTRSGKRSHDRDGLMAAAAAEHLLEALRRAGFVIMKASAAPSHDGAAPAHAVSLGPVRDA